MDIKKDLPKITKWQEEIIDFWSVRGYDSLTHVLGMNISLHKKPRYECTGLDLQYLEQFYDQAEQGIINMMEDIIKEGKADADTCLAVLKKRIMEVK